MTFPWVDTDPDAERGHRLLEWMVEQAEGIPYLAGFYDNDPENTRIAYQDVSRLTAAGLIRDHSGMGGLPGMAAEVTPEGRSAVTRRHLQRSDVLGRRAAVRRGILRWLAESDATEESGQFANWGDWSLSRLSRFYGDPFTVEESDRAAGWLARTQLIDGPRSNGNNGPIRPRLTDAGLVCVEQYDSDPDAYVSSREAVTLQQITWNVSGQQVQVATGDNARQVMNVDVTSEQLVLAMSGLVKILGRFELAGDSEEGQQLVAAAEADLQSARPDGGAARKFLSWVRGRLALATDAAITAAVTAQVTAIDQDLSHLVEAIASASNG
ncbi:hypothetical protein [Longivirga aurantiaca]|uniref:Uncharacterized protein n=1 Tax=Longivirga aurantiaca TaxID=1837743 RepID=A0ABW1SXF0_9ACTN